MSLDDGTTLDHRGEIHQSSLRSTTRARKLSNLDQSVLGIVLRTYPSDHYKNRYSYHFSDRHGFGAVCDVLVLNDGKSSSYWKLSNVMVLPSHPSGLDNYEECLPRGSSKYINGEDFDVTSSGIDINDLDGDWVVVAFLGGNSNLPYITNYWPSPRNKYDPQTSGQGHPNSEGEGKALIQFATNSGRYFRRINGVECVINERGDVFLSTHYAGGVLTPNADGKTTNGRFSREVNPGAGGGVRVNMKTAQPLELNWNEQEDGIGLNGAHDPSLPQTNPQQTTPYSLGSRSATYIRFQNQLASFEVPGLFSVHSQNHIRLTSLSDSDINVGTRLGMTIGDYYEIIVGNDYSLVSKEGNIKLTSESAQVLIEASQEVQIISKENDIIISADTQDVLISAVRSIDISSGVDLSVSAIGLMDLTSELSMSLTTGGVMTLSANSFAFVPKIPGAFQLSLGTTGLEPVIKGASFSFAQGAVWSLVSALALALSAEGALSVATTSAATALINGITNYFAVDLPASMSTSVTVE